jgi:hypothetical protein
MGSLMVRCPQTGQDFFSGIEADPLSFELMPAFNATIRCPLCGIDHSWSKIDAWVREGLHLERPLSTDHRGCTSAYQSAIINSSGSSQAT